MAAQATAAPRPHPPDASQSSPAPDETAIGRAGGGGEGGGGNGGGIEGGGIAGIVIIIAIAFFVIGLIGRLFANIIGSLVSKQREFLADASAVQFTRNPNGIANALNKIRSGFGSEVNSASSGKFSHMFFGIPSKSSGLG